MRAVSLPLALYTGAAHLVPWLVSLPAKTAHHRQNADPARLPERLSGRASAPRPDGKLVWFHAASVGEVAGIIDLARDLCAATGARLLVTTFTKTGGEAAVSRGPADMIHQFLPADTPAATRAFLDHWRPDLAVFTESDLWPILLGAVKKRGIPVALMNVRPSRSRKKWPRLMGRVLGQFDLVTTQNTQVAAELVSLGLNPAVVQVTGDTKAMAAALPVDANALAKARAVIGTRPVWIAASTHAADEAPVLAAHANALAHIPDLLLIILPRHPERGAALHAARPAPRRSRDEYPTADDPVWIVDTLGETGLFYRIAPLVFLGGSFGHEGGHNPYEPAQLGAAILTGPHFANQVQPFSALVTQGAAQIVQNTAELAAAVTTLTQSAALTQMQSAAQDYMQDMAAGRDRPRLMLQQLMDRA